ncbi:MAG: hypothetical protein ACI37J_00730, partial [Candidatus Bruticola sp.]
YVILALYARGQLSDSQKELAREIPQVCANTIVLPLSSPYFLEDMAWIDTAVTAYNYSQASLEAALAKIFA